MDAAVSAAGLAYLGDAVYELMVRDMLINDAGLTAQGFHETAQRFVSAKAQAALYRRVFDVLTEEEQAVLRRGRNLHPVSRAKNASVSDYRHATGLETLFGYLHYQGRRERLAELFEYCKEGVTV